MELRVLKYFLGVAKEQNMSKAAEQLYITQPTLSRQIMELEQELQVKLFDRGNRSHKMTLTAEGELLFKRAEEIITLASKTEAEFKTSKQSISGEIYIGGGETDAMRAVAKTIHCIQEEYPLIRFHIYSGNADDVTEKLDKGLLDFGVLIQPWDIKKYEYVGLPEKDTWGLLMKKNVPLAQHTSISASDLSNLPLIVSRQSLVRNQLSGWSGISYDSLNIKATYNLIYNAAILVEEGVGYALCLDKLANTAEDRPLTFKPLSPRLETSLDVVWKKNQVFSKVQKLFIEKLQKNI